MDADTQQDAWARGKRTRMPLDEALPSLPSPPSTKYCKKNVDTRGGAICVGGLTSAAESAGSEVSEMHGGVVEGES